MVEVRLMEAGEADALGHVMWRAIHEGPSLYSEGQKVAWLAAPPQDAAWEDKLKRQAGRFEPGETSVAVLARR